MSSFGNCLGGTGCVRDYLCHWTSRLGFRCWYFSICSDELYKIYYHHKHTRILCGTQYSSHGENGFDSNSLDVEGNCISRQVSLTMRALGELWLWVNGAFVYCMRFNMPSPQRLMHSFHPHSSTGIPISFPEPFLPTLVWRLSHYAFRMPHPRLWRERCQRHWARYRYWNSWTCKTTNSVGFYLWNMKNCRIVCRTWSWQCFKRQYPYQVGTLFETKWVFLSADRLEEIIPFDFEMLHSIT